MAREVAVLAKRMSDDATQSSDIDKLLQAQHLLRESRDERNYYWIFEAQLGEVRERAAKGELDWKSPFEAYSAQEYVDSDFVKPPKFPYGFSASGALNTLRKGMMPPAKGMARVRVYDFWTYLEFGPMSEQQRFWASHLLGEEHPEGVLFLGRTSCTLTSMGRFRSNYERARLGHEMPIAYIQSLMENRAKKPRRHNLEGSEWKGEVMAGSEGDPADYLILGAMGYFKNETERLTIPRRPPPRQISSGDPDIVYIE